MKKLLVSILAVLTFAGAAHADAEQPFSTFTVNNIGGWYIVNVTAYKVGKHRPNDAFENFGVNLGQKRVFTSDKWAYFDVRIQIAGGPGDNHVSWDPSKGTDLYLDTYGPSWAPEFYWKQEDR